MHKEAESTYLFMYIFSAFFITYVIYGKYCDKEIIFKLFKRLIVNPFPSIEHFKNTEHEKANIPIYQRPTKFIGGYKIHDYGARINHNQAEADIV